MTSELGELFNDWRAAKKEKRADNSVNSRAVLQSEGIQFEEFSPNHLRVGDFDFWPATGLYIHRKTKLRGRGVFKLVRQLAKEPTQ